MRIIYTTCFILLSLLNYAVAQQQAIDSIQKELKGNIPDTTRAISLMRIAVKYETIDTAISAAYYRQAIAFAVSHKLDYKAAVIYQNQAYLFMNSGRYEASKKSLDTTLLYLKKSVHPNTAFVTAQTYSSLAYVYRYMNNYKENIHYETLAIAMYKKLNKPVNIVNSYTNLSSVYHDMADYEKQEEAARKALEYERISGETKDYFKCYTFLLFALTEQNRFAEAKPIADSAKKYYNANDDFNQVISYHLVAGLLDMNLDKLDDAKQNFQQAYSVAEANKHLFSITQAKLQLARVLTLQKKFSEAEPLLLAAYNESLQTGEAAQRSDALNYLSRFYEESGNAKKALSYYKSYKEIADSLSNQQNKKYAVNLEIEYQTKEKEAHIKQLEADKQVQQLSLQRKNILNVVLMASALALIIIGLLLYRNYANKQKLQQQRIAELETEKQLSATSAVLKGEEQERTRLAKDLHDGLGGMLSGIKYSLNNMKGNLIMTQENAQSFERSIDMLDSSIKEMRRVAHNMMPESLVKFGLDTALKDFCSEINQTGMLHISYQSISAENATADQTKAITIYRIVQELISNSLKHADAKNAIVQLTKTGGQLTVTVEDDGKGFNTALLNISKGIGWSNIQNRVELLKGKLDINSQPGKGTSVLIEIDV